MDAIDDAILRELTVDARLPYSELGARVGLSPNAAANRVGRLVADGTIRGFTIVRGGGGRSRAGARGVRRGPAGRRDLERGLHGRARRRGFPQVLDAVHVTGSYDYLLHAVVPDPAALDLFVRRLKREAGVAQTFTRLAMRA